MTRHSYRNGISLFVACAVTLLSACGESSKTSAQLPGLLVSVIEVQPSVQQQRLDLTGQIVAREQVRITAEMEGLRIVRVLADQGQRVGKNAVLLELDSAAMDAEYSQAQQQRLTAAAMLKQAQAQQAQAQSALNLALADAKRYDSVAELGAVSAQDMQARRNAAQQAQDGMAVAAANVSAAVAQQDIAQSALTLALQRRTRLTIRAPMAGVLSERHAEIGSIVTMSEPPLFMLMPDGAREFEAELDLSQLATLPDAAMAEVEIAQFAQSFKARLRTRAINVRPGDRRGPVRFELIDADRIPIGASASARLQLTAQSSVSLPPSAVLFDPEPWVYIVDQNQRVQRREVRLSNASGALLVVRDGLAAGEKVVASAATLLSPGALIRPVLPTQRAAVDSSVLAPTDRKNTAEKPL
jgi:HlyD family secretion protein